MPTGVLLCPLCSGVMPSEDSRCRAWLLLFMQGLKRLQALSGQVHCHYRPLPLALRCVAMQRKWSA